MTKQEITKSFAAKFIERSNVLGYKGKKRDDAALDYYCGAIAILELLSSTELVKTFGMQAALMISARGFKSVEELARGPKLQDG